MCRHCAYVPGIGTFTEGFVHRYLVPTGDSSPAPPQRTGKENGVSGNLTCSMMFFLNLAHPDGRAGR